VPNPDPDLFFPKCEEAIAFLYLTHSLNFRSKISNFSLLARTEQSPSAATSSAYQGIAE
tara:strand:- start:97 stop:273 length:177 start_codon:yes stop_codon:yes gene_type:complete